MSERNGDYILLDHDHVTTAAPDTKGRFALRRWLTREPAKTWKVYRLDEGRTIVLEAVPA